MAFASVHTRSPESGSGSFGSSLDLRASEPHPANESTCDLEYGRFLVVRGHAKGGLGLVSLGYDRDLQRRVALKEINPDKADDARSRRRFLNEAEITSQLEHPGIVPVYALGQTKAGRPYIAMKFIQGRTLADAIAEHHQLRSALGLRQLLQKFVAVCQTLAYAHSREVIHRDLKPHNIMVGEYGETLVVDWGLAKRLDTEAHVLLEAGGLSSGEPNNDTPSQILTLVGDVVGTPAYMAPEQAHGQTDDLGPRSDIYALGAILYELLCGQPAYRGADSQEILKLVQQGDFPPPNKHLPGVPRALEAICLRAMAYDPAQRYSSATSLSRDIEHWLADEPVDAFPETRWQRTERWVRRHQDMVLASLTAVAIVLLALGAMTWLWVWQQRSAQVAQLRLVSEILQEDPRGRRLLESRGAVQKIGLDAATTTSERLREQIEAALEAGDHPGAAVVIGNWLQVNSAHEHQVLLAAGWYTNCAKLAEHDAKLGPVEQQTAADRYRQQALDALALWTRETATQ